MFEHRHEALLPRGQFYRRLVRHGLRAGEVLLAALAIGVAGYHYLAGFSWLDSLLNASMILSGMGPVGELHTTAGKLFASFYALFSGVVFLTSAGVLFAPVVHRFLHRFHLETQDAPRPRRPSGP